MTDYARQLQEIDKRLKAIFDFIKTLTTNNDQKNDAKALENLDSVLICKSSRYAFAVSTIAYNFSHVFRLFYFINSQFLSVKGRVFLYCFAW